MLDELRAGLWSEARSAAATDAFRRNLQRAWIARVTELMEDDEALASDAAPALRGQLVALDTELARALPRVTDRSTRLHFEDVRMRIAEILSTDD
jgi:glutathione synthase/RimK-type ligase-like ATP-grasp enzyme